jgi:hypothetical protein
MNIRNTVVIALFFSLHTIIKPTHIKSVTEVHRFTGIEAYQAQLSNGAVIHCFKKWGSTTSGLCTCNGTPLEQKSLFYCLKELAQHQAAQQKKDDRERDQVAAIMERYMQ